MKETVVRCDLCHRTCRHDPPDECNFAEADWKRLENSRGEHFDVCPGCQNVIMRVYHCDVLDQVVEVSQEIVRMTYGTNS